eukprot:TRINITY_DN1485_c0_g1_i4.p1 TRINITY_DN1485_c0_g1~~TRINITY_DN1485_c0_g1_i4.p1  ORF type:complete len:466 (-),score=103.10 TRINITY_DN1485_c0_g1_i4:180-1577(-)
MREIVFFFFKQKTAYEIGVRLVGSEMCIRDRYKDINKTNQILLEKLIEISQGKWSTVKGSTGFLKGDSQMPRTLNSNFRKREAERIAQENEQLAHRLLNQEPMINARKIKKDTERYYRLRRHMQKLDWIPGKDGCEQKRIKSPGKTITDKERKEGEELSKVNSAPTLDGVKKKDGKLAPLNSHGSPGSKSGKATDQSKISEKNKSTTEQPAKANDTNKGKEGDHTSAADAKGANTTDEEHKTGDTGTTGEGGKPDDKKDDKEVVHGTNTVSEDVPPPVDDEDAGQRVSVEIQAVEAIQAGDQHVQLIVKDGAQKLWSTEEVAPNALVGQRGESTVATSAEKIHFEVVLIKGGARTPYATVEKVLKEVGSATEEKKSTISLGEGKGSLTVGIKLLPAQNNCPCSDAGGIYLGVLICKGSPFFSFGLNGAFDKVCLRFIIHPLPRDFFSSLSLSIAQIYLSWDVYML